MGETMRNLVLSLLIVRFVVSAEFNNDSIVSNLTTDTTISSSFALDFSTGLNSSLVNNGTSFQVVPEDKFAITEVTSPTDSAKTLDRSAFLSEIGIGNFTNATWFTEVDISGIEVNNESSSVLDLDDFRGYKHRYDDRYKYREDNNYKHHRHHDRDENRDEGGRFLSEMENSTNTTNHFDSEFVNAANETNNENSPTLLLDDFRKNSKGRDHDHRDRDHDHDHRDHGDRNRHAAFFSEVGNFTNSTSHLGNEYFNEFIDVANITNNESSSVLSSDLNTDVDNLRSGKEIINETSENGASSTGAFNNSSSLTQPSESDIIEDKVISETSSEPPTGDFWGFKNTLSKLHPWVGWFVGVPSSTDSSIDISNTDATTELTREMKSITDYDHALNLPDLSYVNLNDSSFQLGNYTDNSNRNLSDWRSPRSDVDQNNTIFVASENGTHNYVRDIDYGHSLDSDVAIFIDLSENSTEGRDQRSLTNVTYEDNISKDFLNHTHNENWRPELELNSTTEDERHQRSLAVVSHDDWMVNNTLNHVHNESCGPEFDLEGFNAIFIDLNSTNEEERDARSLTNVGHDDWVVNNTLNHVHNESCGPEFDLEGFNSTFIDLNSTKEEERDPRSLTNVGHDDWVVNNTLNHIHNESCGPEFDLEGLNSTFIDLNSTQEEERDPRSLTVVSHDDWMVNNTLNHVHNESCGPEFDLEGSKAIFINLNSTTEEERDARSLTNVGHDDWIVNNTLNHLHNESCGPEFDLEGFNAIFIDLNSTTEDERHQRSLTNISHDDWIVNNAVNHVHNESCNLEGVNDSFIDLQDNITSDERDPRYLTNITGNTWMLNDTGFGDFLHNSSDNERDMRSLNNVINEDSMINGTNFLTETVLNVTEDLNRTLRSSVSNLFSVNGSESPLNSFLIDLENSTASDLTDNRKERQLDTVDEITTGTSLTVEASTNSPLNNREEISTEESTDGENTVTTDSSLDARTGFIFDKDSIANLVDTSFDKLSLTDFLHEFPTHKPLTLKDILDKVPTRKPLVISKIELSDIIHKPLDKPSLDELVHKDKHHHDHHNHKPSKPTTSKPGVKTTTKHPKHSTTTTSEPSTTSPKPVVTTTTKATTTTTTIKPKTSTYKPYPPHPYSYHPVNYSPDETPSSGIVDGHQAAGMSPPVFARPHEDRFTPDNYQEGAISDQYEISGYSAPVFAEPVQETDYVCPSSLAGLPCPIWLMEKDPHCNTHADCHMYPESMCCLYNCRRRCIGNVYPYKVKK